RRRDSRNRGFERLRRLLLAGVGLTLMSGCAAPRSSESARDSGRIAVANGYLEACVDGSLERAAWNAEAAREALLRSRWMMNAWLEHADPMTGLLPRNLMESRDIWNAKDAAADLYPFLLLTSWFTDPD